ncbi:MAG: AraC family transcriptional regulator ligand-binding domain-containing protein [Hyphomonadaceae bacterium]
MREIVRADAWRGFRELVLELGGDPLEILTAAHVDEAALQFPERYLPLVCLIDSLEMAARRLKRPDFGLLLGAKTTLSVLGTLGIAADHASSGRAGLDVVARYIHLHCPALTLDSVPLPGTMREFVSVGVRTQSRAMMGQYYERHAGSLHRGLGILCGRSYRPLEVHFSTPRLNPIETYVEVFGVKPLFEQPAMGVVVERGILDAYQPGRNPSLRALAETYLSSLGPPRDDTFATRVAGVVRDMLSTGRCSSDNVARSIGMHERTMQRRLLSESTSFERIKDEVRRELAELLLGQPNLSITHIGHMLGYSDTSTFSRRAREWFGMPARRFRSELLSRSSAATGENLAAYNMRQLAPERIRRAS